MSPIFRCLICIKQIRVSDKKYLRLKVNLNSFKMSCEYFTVFSLVYKLDPRKKIKFEKENTY